MTTSRVSPTLLLCYICFLRALQQNRSQARLLYLLNKILPFQSCLSANFLGLGVISDVGLILWRSLFDNFNMLSNVARKQCVFS